MTLEQYQAKSVPWKSWSEWLAVYNYILDESVGSKLKALHILNIWRSRGKVPVSIEGTALILEVMVNDDYVYPSIPECNRRSANELSMMYGMALVRFVNLMTDMAQMGVVAASMDSLASQIDLPSWIVQLRHSAAHGASLPSLSLLRGGAIELLENFILNNYWKSQKLKINNNLENLNNSNSIINLFRNSIYSINAFNEILNFDFSVHWIITTFRDSSVSDLSEYPKWSEKILCFFDSLNFERRNEFVDLLLNSNSLNLIKILLNNKNKLIIYFLKMKILNFIKNNNSNFENSMNLILLISDSSNSKNSIVSIKDSDALLSCIRAELESTSGAPFVFTGIANIPIVLS